jgi:hypothetical protein
MQELLKFEPSLPVVDGEETEIERVQLVDETQTERGGWDENGKPVKPKSWRFHWVQLG